MAETNQLDIELFRLEFEKHNSFPEKHRESSIKTDREKKWDTGICFSGGGASSLPMTVGYLRALANSKILNEADYLSTVSLSCLVCAAHFFSTEDLSTLLGKDVDLKDMSIEHLKQMSCGKLLDIILETKWAATETNCYEDLLSTKVLKELNLDNRIFVSGEGEEVPQVLLSKSKGIVSSNENPFLIMNAKLNLESNKQDVNSLQITSLYTGVPYFRAMGHQLKKHENSLIARFQFCPVSRGSFKKKRVFPSNMVVGGGGISSFAFGCGEPLELVDQSNRKKQSTKVAVPLKPFYLEDAISLACGEKLGMKAVNVDYWPLLMGNVRELATLQPAQRAMAGDASDFEYTGLLSLLQRGVSRAVVFVSSDVPIDMSFRSVRGSLKDTFGLVADPQFMTLFGASPTSSDVITVPNQVFHRRRLGDVILSFQDSYYNGNGMVALETLEVLPNKYWNIKGGNKVEIVFIYTGNAERFRVTLSQDLQDELDKGDRGVLSGCWETDVESTPLQKIQDLKRVQAAIMANHASFVVRTNAELIRSIIEKNKSSG